MYVDKKKKKKKRQQHAYQRVGNDNTHPWLLLLCAFCFPKCNSPFCAALYICFVLSSTFLQPKLFSKPFLPFFSLSLFSITLSYSCWLAG